MVEVASITDAGLSTNREAGGTARLPVARSHHGQTCAGGLPLARGGLLLWEGRATYGISAYCISSDLTPSTTSHTLRESSQLPLWRQPVLRAWLRRNRCVYPRFALLLAALPRMRGTALVVSVGYEVSHCCETFELSRPAVALRSKGERDLAAYRYSLAEWQQRYEGKLLEKEYRYCLTHFESERFPWIYKKCRGTTPGSGRPPFSRRHAFNSTQIQALSREQVVLSKTKTVIYERSAA